MHMCRCCKKGSSNSLFLIKIRGSYFQILGVLNQFVLLLYLGKVSKPAPADYGFRCYSLNVLLSLIEVDPVGPS